MARVSAQRKPIPRPQEYPSPKVLTLGADPEMFAVDEKGNVKSVIGLIGGSKKSPLPVGDGFFVQEDNVALEFNIPTATTKKDFVKNILTGVEHCRKALNKVNLHMHIAGSVEMPKEEMDRPGSFDFGCNPFLDAWTFEKPKALDAGMLNHPLDRFAAGHVHIGIPGINKDPFLRAYWARSLDVCLAAPALFWMNDEELAQEKVRRSMYGKAGSYRPKDYGIEYIALSNFWIKSAARIGAVWDAIDYVYNSYSPARKGHLLGDDYAGITEVLRKGINDCDKRVVQETMPNLLGNNVIRWLNTLPQQQQV